MKQLKKILGLVWMILGPVIICFLLAAAFENIHAQGNKDINKPVPWIIIIGIFTPICVGLVIFGYYSWKGEFDELPQSSAGL
ncbi:MAG: hypothetical protein JWQ27_1392 [Ferruginibacter sp.]|nr:hypothetical protein [Ferruginibacter sp.]